MNKSKIKIGIILLSLSSGLQYSISPVLSLIAEHYPEESINRVQMLVTVPGLLGMLISVLSGWLVLKISKKKLLTIGCFIMGVTGFMPLLRDQFELLFLSRVIFGLGLGLTTALSSVVIMECFQGKERVSAMGLQGASVGVGMLLTSVLGGILGKFGYQFAYFLHIIGFISMLAVVMLLPDTGRTRQHHTEEIRLNRKVIGIFLLGFVEFMFLLTFNTNIAMHLSERLRSDTENLGVLIGTFSGVQIFAGLILGFVSKYTKKHTLAVALSSLMVGTFIMSVFTDSFEMLLLGAFFCGMSQGIFVPQAMCELASMVQPIAMTMASAGLIVALNIGALVSPTVLNTLSLWLFNEVNTVGVYKIASMGIGIVSVVLFIVRSKVGQQTLRKYITNE